VIPPLYTLGGELSSGSFTDLSSVCLRASYNRTLYDAFTPVGADSGLFELANDVGSLSPLLNSNLKMGRRVRLQAQHRELYLDPVGSGQSTYATANHGPRNLATLDPNVLEVVMKLGGILSASGSTTPTPLAQEWPGRFRFSDHRSHGLVLEWSTDGTNVRTISTGSFLSGGGPLNLMYGIRAERRGRFFRFRFIADSGASSLAMLSWEAASGTYYPPSPGADSQIQWSVIRSATLGIPAGATVNVSTSIPLQVFANTSQCWFGAEVFYAQVNETLNGTAYVEFDPNSSFNAGVGVRVFDGPTATQWTVTANGTQDLGIATLNSYDLFTGRLRSISTRPVVGERTTVLEARTELDLMQHRLLRAPMFVNMPSQSLFTEIATRSLISSWATDALSETANFVDYDDRVAANALQQLVTCGLYKTYIDGAGTLRLRNRTYSGISSSSTNTLAEQPLDLNYSMVADQIINRAHVSAAPREQSSDVSTLAWLTDPILIASGSGLGFFLSYHDPRNVLDTTAAGSLETLVSSQDYYGSPNSDGTGTALTATLSVTLVAFAESAVSSIYNSGASGDVYLNRFQLRGYPILRNPNMVVQVNQSSSQAAYGIFDRSFGDLLMADYVHLANIANIVVNNFAEPRGRLTAVLTNDWPDVFAREVGDVQNVINSLSGVNSIWVIRQARHSVSLLSGLEHTTTYEMERPLSFTNS